MKVKLACFALFFTINCLAESIFDQPDGVKRPFDKNLIGKWFTYIGVLSFCADATGNMAAVNLDYNVRYEIYEKSGQKLFHSIVEQVVVQNPWIMASVGDRSKCAYELSNDNKILQIHCLNFNNTIAAVTYYKISEECAS